MSKLNSSYYRKLTTAIVLLLCISVHANSEDDSAEQTIKQYYNAFAHILKSTTSTTSRKARKELTPLLMVGWDDERGSMAFPNEPHLLFNSNDRPSINPLPYFNEFDFNRFQDIGTEEERETLHIDISDISYGKIEMINQPIKFADNPNNRDSIVVFYRMKVNKTYKVTKIVQSDDGIQKEGECKNYTLHDNIAVRRLDGRIVRLRNECGGSAEFTADELNYDGLILEGLEAWKDKRYQDAYKTYRKIIELRKDNPPAIACFHLGLMMYDQWKGRAVYAPEINRRTAEKHALNYMKKGASMRSDNYVDGVDFAKSCYEAYYNMITRD